MESETEICIGKAYKLGEEKNLVDIRLGKFSVAAMLDCGASISCLSLDMYKRSGLAKEYDMEQSDVHAAQTVDGSHMKILGKISIPVTICRLTLTQTFYIFKKLNQSVILGRDFLKEQKAHVDYDQDTLQIQGGLVIAQMFSSPHKSGLARLINRISIPPQSATVAKVKVRNSGLKGMTLVEPIRTLPSKYQVIGARAVANLQNEQTCVQILNPTHEWVYLKANEPVARIDTIENNDLLCEIDDSPSTCVSDIISQHTQADTSNTQTAADNTQSNLHTDTHIPLINELKTDSHYIEIANSLGVDLSQSTLSEEQKSRLLVLIGQNRDVFATCTAELGHTDLYPHKIVTQDVPPVRRPQYRTTPEQKAEIERQTKELEEHGIISKSNTLWQAPVLLVKKKSGDYRFAVDFRGLNKVTHPINFPITHFQDVVDCLGQAKASIYSVIDMAQGFFQIPLDPETKHKTGFVTHQGVWEFNRLPFGLMNSPMAFSMVMTEVLRGFSYKFALTYIDDCLIFSQSFDDHLVHLSQVFDRFRKANLKLKMSKCHFAAKEVKYLGHRFTQEGIGVDSEKIKAVVDFPTPKNQTDVRAFLGLSGYYRRFVDGYAAIARPLNQPLRKDSKFQWTEQCEVAFKKLKEKLTSPPILAFPDFSDDSSFLLYTDASHQSIGYVLGQRDKKGREVVIGYAGRSLRPAERNWGISDLEGLALVEGIRYFHTYLANRPFTVYTDHIALRTLKENKSTGRLGRWAVFLQGYQYEVVYKSGKHHGNADAMSRRPYEDETPKAQSSEADDPPIDPQVCSVNVSHTTEYKEYTLHFTETELPQVSHLKTSRTSDTLSEMICAIETYQQMDPVTYLSEISDMTPEKLRQAQIADSDFTAMFAYKEDGKVLEERDTAHRLIAESQFYETDNGVLYHLYYPRTKGHKWTDVKKQLAVPHILRDAVLKSYHDALPAGHYGIERTYEAVRMKYFWPSMFKDIKIYCQTCEPCQRTKRYIHPRKAELQPLPVGDIFSRVHMDLLGPLPTSEQKYRYILLVCDSFSKWCDAYPLYTMEAKEVAWKLYDEWICRYGCMNSILTDRGSNFMSALMKELCSIFRISKISTSSYHAATNSAAEKMNSVILQKLRIYCNKKQTDWPQLLPSIMASYRMSPSVYSTKYSPYYIVFGRECTLPLDTALIPTTTAGTPAEDHLRRIIENQKVCRELVKENIKAAQAKYKKQYDKNADTPNFKVRDSVWLYNPKTQPGLTPKLMARWYGPYYITEKTGPTNYRLRDLSTHKAVKNVVHSDRLKPYYSPALRPTNIPEAYLRQPPEPIELEVDVEVERMRPAEQKQMENRKQKEKQEQKQDIHQETETKTTTPADDPNDWEIVKILKGSYYRGRMVYKVKYRNKKNESSKTEWVYAEDLPVELRKDFHIKYTFSGKCRKRVNPRPPA